MMNKFMPLKNVLTQTTKLSQQLDWRDIARQSRADITVEEFVASASSYPIFFIKNSHSGKFSSTALLGLTQDNVFFDGSPSTSVAYIPKSLTMLPFAFGVDEQNDNQLTICINTDSQLLNQPSGEPMLDAKGEETDYIKTVQQRFASLYKDNVITERFIDALIKLNLLVELEIQIQLDNGQKQTLKGLYNINEEALGALSDQQKLTFLSQGYYPPIMAMLASLAQINRMIALYDQGSAISIKGVNIKAIA
jgi:hypothetical protein